ncbi:MAG TPA: type II toxin-antitoxin system RelE/ParE family toxin [Humisphaera sp.]|jgi:plasmid stabilization system protein ParE|nr:type II toxin-antitoxin system RelE/ParE family toxin [Humisphaera sp.]
MSGYSFTSDAYQDLRGIRDYLMDTAGDEVAERVVKEIRNECGKLADMPGMGHYREDLLDRGFRFWSVYAYVIGYRWKTKPIQIIAVVHGTRDLAAAFFRRRKASI